MLIAERHQRFIEFMSKHFDTYFGAVEPEFEHGNPIVDFSRPKWHTYKHDQSSWLLSAFPEEYDLIQQYFRHCPKGDLAFDVGAYCGLSTWEMSHRFKRVIAFEPDPLNLGCLITNTIGLPNVTCLPYAITAKSGKVSFLTEGSPGGSTALSNHDPFHSTEVLSLSLTDACALYGIPDLIAMDIEMAEVEVLDASRYLLSRNKISLSIDTDHGDPNTSGPVEAILHECGYNVESEMVQGLSNTWGWK